MVVSGLLDYLTVGRIPSASTRLAPLNVSAILVGMFSKVELDVLRTSMNAQMEGVGQLDCHTVDLIQTAQTTLVPFPAHARWDTKTGLKILAVRTLTNVGWPQQQTIVEQMHIVATQLVPSPVLATLGIKTTSLTRDVLMLMSVPFIQASPTAGQVKVQFVSIMLEALLVAAKMVTQTGGQIQVKHFHN